MASRLSNGVSVEVAEKVLGLMASDGVELTDDLNQCEGAIWGWIQRQGAAALERHLAQKNSVTKERGDPVSAGSANGS